MQAAQDAVAIAAFERGIDATLELVRGLQSEREHVEDHVATAAALVRSALGVAQDESVPEVHAPASTADALHELRRTYVAELDRVADTPAFRDAVRVFEAIERVSDALIATASGEHRTHEDRTDQPPMNPIAAEFAMQLRLSPVNPIVSLTHDMRSPLTSILFLIESVRAGSNGPLTVAQDRALGLVYSAAFGLTSMVNDVLMLARGHVHESTSVPFSLSELMRGVEQIVAPIAEDRQLRLVVTLPDRGDARIGYPVMLSRVILNLVTNALKFTDHGAVTIDVRELDASHVEFSVRDTGRGIPPELLPTLLDPFRALAKRDFRGRRHVFSSAGLGLSICQTLLRTMESELHVDSVLGEGTRFSFVLALPPAPPARGDG